MAAEWSSYYNAWMDDERPGTVLSRDPNDPRYASTAPSQASGGDAIMGQTKWDDEGYLVGINPATGEWQRLYGASDIGGDAVANPYSFTPTGVVGGNVPIMGKGQDPKTFVDQWGPTAIGLGTGALFGAGALSALGGAGAGAAEAAAVGDAAAGGGTLTASGSATAGELAAAEGALGSGLTPGATGAGGLTAGTGATGLSAGSGGALAGGSLAGESLYPVLGGASGAGAASLGAGAAGTLGVGGAVAGGSALSRILDGSGTQADYLSVLGNAAPSILGAIGSYQQTSALKDLADKYAAYGAPSRSRFEASMTPGFDPTTIPGYKGALDTASGSILSKLSAQGGNPYGNPGGLIEANKQIVSGTALPAVNEYQRLNLAGGFNQALNSAGGFGQSAIGSQGNFYNAIGAGVNDVLNPPKSLAQLYSDLRRASLA